MLDIRHLEKVRPVSGVLLVGGVGGIAEGCRRRRLERFNRELQLSEVRSGPAKLVSAWSWRGFNRPSFPSAEGAGHMTDQPLKSLSAI